MAQLNFQIPDQLKQKFTQKTRARGVTMQAVLVEFIQDWCGESGEPTLTTIDHKLDTILSALQSPITSRFKIGDRVRLIKTPKGKRPSIIGSKGTVASFNKGRYSVELESGTNCEVTAECIELI